MTLMQTKFRPSSQLARHRSQQQHAQHTGSWLRPQLPAACSTSPAEVSPPPPGFPAADEAASPPSCHSAPALLRSTHSSNGLAAEPSASSAAPDDSAAAAQSPSAGQQFADSGAADATATSALLEAAADAASSFNAEVPDGAAIAYQWQQPPLRASAAPWRGSAADLQVALMAPAFGCPPAAPPAEDTYGPAAAAPAAAIAIAHGSSGHGGDGGSGGSSAGRSSSSGSGSSLQSPAEQRGTAYSAGSEGAQSWACRVCVQEAMTEEAAWQHFKVRNPTNCSLKVGRR